MSDFKTVMRKSAYCIGCRVCEANCPNGYITMESENVHIDNKCKQCKKCHEVFHGCLVANSLRLPKGENKMGSIDRYGNMGIEYKWVKQYFEKGDDFWDSPHGLGTNMVKYLKSFLNDSDITTKTKLNYFGEKVIDLGVESIESWVMICNLAYTSEFNWWIKNTKQNCTYTPDSLFVNVRR